VSRFRKVDVRVWNDERFRPFSDDAKLAFLFILTHPHLTALGAMRGTLDGLAAELGWPPRRFRAAVAPATGAGMIEVNDTAAYIGLPNFLRYNEPEGPNSVKKAWVTALDSIPECPEKRTLILRCRKYLDGKSRDFKTSLGEAIWEAFSDAISDGIRDGIEDGIEDAYRDASPIQEQEQEQEQEHLHGGEALTSSNGHHPPERAWLSAEALVELYNATIPPGHPRVVELSSGRREKAVRYLKQFPKREWWEQVFAEIGRSEFLRHGSKDRPNFRGDLDWLLTKGQDGTENALKVAEGRYRDQRAGAVEDADDDTP